MMNMLTSLWPFSTSSSSTPSSEPLQVVGDDLPELDFKDFILAAQRAGDNASLIIPGNIIIPESRNYHYNRPIEEVRERTWKIFERAINKAFRKEKLKYFCDRYDVNLEQTNVPLKSNIIEKMGIAAASVYTYDLEDCLQEQRKQEREIFGDKSLCEQSVENIRQLEAAATQNSYLGKEEAPEKVTGGPVNYLSQSNHEIDRRRCKLFEGIEYLGPKDPRIPPRDPFLQRLSMGITGLILDEVPDSELVIPVLGAGEGDLDYYKTRIVSEGGLMAVAYIPLSRSSTLKPILSFRCTKQAPCQKDFVESVLNDVNENLGEKGYKASEKALRELMEDPEFNRGEIEVVAYSLGVSHATYFMRDHWKKVSKITCINGTGCEASVVEELANEINAATDRIPPEFTIHRNRGDIVNHVGKKHIGWGINHPKIIIRIIEWLIHNYPIPIEPSDDEDHIYPLSEIIKWLNLHAVRPMDSEQEYQFEVFKGPTQCTFLLDTYARKQTFEKMRLIWGKYMDWVISIGSQILSFVFRVLGIEYFKTG